MKTIAIIDTETSGVDPAKDALLEVAVVLWSVEHRAILTVRSWLVDAGLLENPALAINGIEPRLLVDGGDSLDSVLCDVKSLTLGADACVAYNAEFDRQWLPCIQAPWICAMDGLDYPRTSGSKALTAVALAHGVGVVDAHRALADCLTVARLFERVAEIYLVEDIGVSEDYASFRSWLARGLRPKSTYEVADKSFSPERNALAKAAGFRWDATKRVWSRRMAAEDVSALPFRVLEVSP